MELEEYSFPEDLIAEHHKSTEYKNMIDALMEVVKDDVIEDYLVSEELNVHMQDMFNEYNESAEVQQLIESTVNASLANETKEVEEKRDDHIRNAKETDLKTLDLIEELVLKLHKVYTEESRTYRSERYAKSYLSTKHLKNIIMRPHTEERGDFTATWSRLFTTDSNKYFNWNYERGYTFPSFEGQIIQDSPMNPHWNYGPVHDSPMNPDWNYGPVYDSPMNPDWNYGPIQDSPMNPDWNHGPVHDSPMNPDWNYGPVHDSPMNPDWNYGPIQDSPMNPDWNYGPVHDSPMSPDWNYGPVHDSPMNPDWNYGPVHDSPMNPDWNYGPVHDSPMNPDWNYGPVHDSPMNPDWNYGPVYESPKNPDWNRGPVQDSPMNPVESRRRPDINQDPMHKQHTQNEETYGNAPGPHWGQDTVQIGYVRQYGNAPAPNWDKGQEPHRDVEPTTGYGPEPRTGNMFWNRWRNPNADYTTESFFAVAQNPFYNGNNYGRENNNAPWDNGSKATEISNEPTTGSSFVAGTGRNNYFWNKWANSNADHTTEQFWAIAPNPFHNNNNNNGRQLPPKANKANVLINTDRNTEKEEELEEAKSFDISRIKEFSGQKEEQLDADQQENLPKKNPGIDINIKKGVLARFQQARQVTQAPDRLDVPNKTEKMEENNKPEEEAKSDATTLWIPVSSYHN